MNKKPVFKHYDQSQPSLLPPSYEDLIPENHPVRTVNEIIERIDITELKKTYKGGGTSSYHPRMLLKVIVYGYLRNIYSSRKIEQAAGENIHFMWLAGSARPDHNTIADFRSKRLKKNLQKIFNQVVLLLAEEGVLSLQEVTLDGTKLEANANRYTFVWGKAVKRSKERIEQQLRELWKYVEEVYENEEQEPNEPEFKELDAEKVTKAIETINEALEGKPVAKKIKQKLSYARRNWPKKMAEYEEKEQILGGRNSYSKTDTDATFMRMKDDHMQNGQLKPGYNVQASTNQHYILNYTLGQTTTDTVLLKDHLKEHKQSYDEKPKEIIADAGYGSEENYEYLEQEKITAYVKYNYFHKEMTSRKHQENPFLADHLHYDEKRDRIICPIGQEMKLIGVETKETATGYKQEIKKYRAQNCRGCPMRGPCHKAQGNRIVQRNANLQRHRKKTKKLLLSEVGQEKIKQRWKVEAVFGNIKQNKGFKRFLLRGLEKVKIEMGLVAIAHNLNRYNLEKAAS
jgi:transposase